jgi:acetyl esterase/lipase
VINRSLGGLFAAWMCCASFASAEDGYKDSAGVTHPVIAIWGDTVPNVMKDGGEKTVRISDQGDHVVSNVHNPTLTAYPAAAGGSGAAVIVIPGGGHRELWTDHEGHTLAQFLAKNRISAFVLEYRLARAPNSTYTIEGDALNDTKRAIRTVRAGAANMKIDPHKIGVIGFSAGGQLALLSATRFDAGDPAGDLVAKQSSRPDFAALVYPGVWNELGITAQTPPTFLLCGSDDRAEVVAGITRIYSALRDAKVPAELHMYDGVPHGFGVRATNTGPVTRWPTQFVEWLQARKLTP